MGRRRSWTTEQLVEAVKNSFSAAGVLRELGLRIAGGSYQKVQGCIRELGLDTSHWTEQGHRLGTMYAGRPAPPIEQVLVLDEFVQPGKLKNRLIGEGLMERKCAWCRRRKWRSKPIPLELDHIDGDHLNNQLLNLRLLCPNCHAQTPTYKGRNARYPNVPPLKDIAEGIARCGSVRGYASEIGVTAGRVLSWLRSDRLRARDAQLAQRASGAVETSSPGGEIGETQRT